MVGGLQTHFIKASHMVQHSPTGAQYSLRWPLMLPAHAQCTPRRGVGVYVEPLAPLKKHRKIIGIQVSTARQSYNFPVFFSASDWGLSGA